MSPSRRNFDMRISLPPRLMMTLTGSASSSGSPLSSPCSSAPHTPMPYDMVTTPDCNAQQFQDAMYFDDRESISSAGSKRGREDDEEELAWTEEDIDTMQAALLHPFRPLSTPYPPGELPPPTTLDELTHQIVKYAYRPSPIKRSSRTKQAVVPNPREDGWTHTWTATRRKLFRLALSESQSAHGLDAEERKLPRNERVGRPGLKRMDSMDFLDQEEDEQQQDAEDVGRAIRLSTSLQNSAKTAPHNLLSRSMSDDVVTAGSSSSSSSSTTTVNDLPSMPSAIVLTPASPVAPAAAAPPLRRRGSSRAGLTKAARPSLLQRGRSFTASDLEADASIIPDSPVAKTAAEARSTTASSSTSAGLRAAPFTVAPMTTLEPSVSPLLALTTGSDSSSRLTRSRSNGGNLNAHAKQKSFIADRQPSTTERAMLAMPFEAPSARPSTTRTETNGGWSDSDEEGSTRLRHVKKIRPIRGQRPISASALQPSFQAQLLSGPALRSPFEEKQGMSF